MKFLLTRLVESSKVIVEEEFILQFLKDNLSEGNSYIVELVSDYKPKEPRKREPSIQLTPLSRLP